MNVRTTRFLLSAVLILLAFSIHARTYLVSVGIADYSSYPEKVSNLRLPPADAKAIVDIYSKNGSVDYSLVTDKKATKANILKAIGKVFANAGPDDIVVFFFSGHGYPGGFCAADGKIGYDEIRNAMSKSKSKNKMMFVDACRSGGMRVDDKKSQSAVATAKKANVMLFLSSRNNENSIEKKGMKNGYFTTYLLKALKGNADVNKDRKISAKELFDFVNPGVARVSDGVQHPVMWGNFDDNMTVMKW